MSRCELSVPLQRREEHIVYEPKINSKKFRDLMLYLAHLSRKDPHFGAVKLNKLLYYCDFIAFFRLGAPITGAEYRRLPEGPAPLQLLSERDYLIEHEEARLERQPYFRYVQQRLVPTSDDASLWTNRFSTAELAIISEVLEAMWNMTAREVSELSHRELGWILAEPKEVIPYETAALAPEGDVEADAMFGPAD